MKIFGWMHKKLQLGTTEYHRVAHRNSPDVLVGEERGAMLAARAVKERETEALLLPHHVLLTIGTFGHLSDPHQQQQQQIIREEEQVSTDHEEDLKPASQQKGSLIVAEVKPTATTALAASLHSELTPKPAESADVEQSLKKVQEVVITEEEITSQERPLLKEDKEKIEKRTTLADLFAAETASAAGESPDAATSTHKQQTATSPTKKAKKTKKAEESPTSAAAATKKIHRLITRMLKKRIHPDQLARGEERHAKIGGASDGGEERRRGLHYRLP